MRMFRLYSVILALSLLATGVFIAAAPTAYGQTSVTGAMSGSVVDSAGAVVPNAAVTITNVGTGATIKLSTNSMGRYTATNLAPGMYKVSAAAINMQSETSQINVLVGTTTEVDVKVTPTGSKTVIEVTSTTEPLVDTQNVALATTFNTEQLDELPAPGGDVTTVAFTAPGVAVNAGGSYGNFSSDGLPGISNLYVLNGFDNQDPFLNLNNSGSSNLTLGQGELAEATVIQNAYNSQYGRAAGAEINYVTKSGTNQYHGELLYNYNGTVLNSNGWFNSFAGAPRPHAVSNEWAMNAGGPILHDKVFFFADFEGLRYVLPNSGFLTTPSPQLETYSLSQVASENLPVDVTNFANQTFNIYNAASKQYSSQPVTTAQSSTLGCGAASAGGLAGTPAPGGGTFGVDTPCMLQGFASANNFNKEWLFTARIDWNINDKQKIYGRFKADHGSQPTYTSYLNPLFDAVSIQPEYEGQFNHTYIFTPTKTNVFVAAANWYAAYFGPADDAASLAVYPYFGVTDYGYDGSGTAQVGGLSLMGVPYYLTQGRDVAQYQLVDDFTWIKGKHTIRFGENFRRDLISDYDQRIETIFPELVILDLPDFTQFQIGPTNEFYPYNSFNQAFTNEQTAHLALYNIGMYAQDEYQISEKLKLTFGGRIDRTGNPLCHNGCYSEYAAGTFGSGALTSPYTASAGGPIHPQNWNAFPSVQSAIFQGRVGFNYSIDRNTEIRGGFGMFSDLYPASFIDGVIQNFPNYFAPPITQGILSPTGAGNVVTAAAAANTTVQSGFKSGEGWSAINAALAKQNVFLSSPPSINAYFNGEFKEPMYYEYSVQIQRQLGRQDALILTYAGNSGNNEIIQDPYINPSSGAFCPESSACPAGTASGSWYNTGAPLVGGIGVAPTNQNFGKITAFMNNSISNYNALQVNLKHAGHGLTGEVSYTYAHSLDDISNGGTGLAYGASSVLAQVSPTLSGTGNLNYSNSDYDIRHNITGDWVYTEPYKASNKFLNEAAGGWILGGKTYWRTGTPYSVMTNQMSDYGDLGNNLMAQRVASGPLTNKSISDPHGCVTSACLDSTEYVAPGSQDTFGNVRRNALFGPHYVDTDLSLLKHVVRHERLAVSIGADAFNIFNNVNFGNPGSTLGASNFGYITNTLAPPTSPYGSFQGAAVTQRVLVVTGQLTF